MSEYRGSVGDAVPEMQVAVMVVKGHIAHVAYLEAYTDAAGRMNERNAKEHAHSSAQLAVIMAILRLSCSDGFILAR
ncbi:MAG: hypothetical protein ACK4K7_07570 [Allosphingosinicella sp.]|uniref:hypothetical protein n=1 Tax=Allosphingosinicella sp. TaxID=2823234 RepID=UPI003956881C